MLPKESEMHVSTLVITYCVFSQTQKYFWFSAYPVQHFPAFVANQDLGKLPGWALCCCYAKAPRHFIPTCNNIKPLIIHHYVYAYQSFFCPCDKKLPIILNQ